ncbi:uncharacterized protein DUF3231 [Bacillus oleivorans]|uniref:Uncharacterized protein DUF3231 n=1 Tax=Bacillus oleivorans TaxID=1448271 RepID=A0A285CP64_9BACI|nr:DUF3231 family protein [Bacillus oleivorans]SNX69370.1 uncharacterized protein DUF3231 [Bacillus oleivorans]
MEKEHHIRLTSAELSSLWTTFLADSLSICMLKYFLEKVDDTEIKPIIEHALRLSNDHIEIMKEMFKDERIPIPKGFTDEDVNPNAPRLFQDTLFLNYIKHMTKGGLATYGAILPNIVRKDVREFFSSCLVSTTELYNEATSLLLSKGIEVRPPYIPYQTEVDFVNKQSFLAGWFGEQRPLTGIEIMNFYANVQTNKIGEAITIGFGQVAKSKKVRDYMQRGKEIAKKHMKVFAKYLSEYDLPVPMTWDHEVANVTEPPFSDKLMMFHISLLNASGMGNYGAAISMSQRRDIAANYARLTAEVGQYAEDGMNIMIDNGWLERPPHAADRGQLIKHRKN